MTLEELPLFGISVRILKFWSFMLASNNWRHYLTVVIPMTLVDLSQLGHILFTPEPIVVLVRHSYHMVLWSNALLRGLNLVSKSDKYESFLRNISNEFFEIQRNEGVEMNNILEATCKTAKTIEKANMVVATGSVFGFLMYPLLARVRLLPYGAYIPGFNIYASPLYEFMYVFQAIVTIPASCVYIPFTNLLLAFILFAVLMNKVLKHHLSKLKDFPKNQIWREVIWCIQYQLKIIRFVKTINSLVTYIYLVEFITSGVLLCALLFLLNIVGLRHKMSEWKRNMQRVFEAEDET